MPDWAPQARDVLFRVGLADRGWGYRLGGRPSVEPTVYACLALLASDPPGQPQASAGTVAGAARWLAQMQQPSGAVGIAPGIQQSHWPTAHALLLWATREGFQDQRDKAVAWLLQLKGATIAKGGDDPVGHDTTLVGWPWVVGTHSWIEPTAMAILALRREGHLDHPRTQEGLKVIRDRPVADGGWNYGNSSVFGNSLRAQPAPSGQALLALAGAAPEDAVVTQACAYLERTLPSVRAAMSLSWGLLGLTAWGRRPADADAWLEQAFTQMAERSDPPYLLALALLAASPQALGLLGLGPQAEPAGPEQGRGESAKARVPMPREAPEEPK